MTVSRSRVVLLAGAALALLVAAALFLTLSPKPRVAASPAVAGRGLQLEMGKGETRADASKPLRCFVDGRFVGELPLDVCATRNGVDAKALDVGVDRNGQVAAGQDLQLQPLPATPPLSDETAAALPPIPPPVAEVEPPPAAVSVGLCQAYNDAWRPVAGGVTLATCVQLLFDGRCERPGEALYARWGAQTLRLVPGRVEISRDNVDFHPLVPQARDCSLPPG